MKVHLLTLFPEMFCGVFEHSIIARASNRGIIDIQVHNIRDYTYDKHHIVDDYPYGGGAGMVMKPEPIFKSVEAIRTSQMNRIILLSAQGRLYNQRIAESLTDYEQLIIICGHYEGVDERVSQYLVDEELSIGDYLLSGGEIAAMVIVDSIVRLLPGAIGSEFSLEEESHKHGLLEYPHYTRPAEYRGWSVPEVLLSGNHEEIARWRRKQSVLRTAERRPDLLETAEISEDERKLVAGFLHNN